MDEGHSRGVVDKYIISLQGCKGFQHPLISVSSLSAIIDVLTPNQGPESDANCFFYFLMDSNSIPKLRKSKHFWKIFISGQIIKTHSKPLVCIISVNICRAP